MRLLLTVTLLCSLCPAAVHAQARTRTVICKQDSNGDLTLRTRRCARGETRISNISALEGADGSALVYGDGSSGPLVVSQDTTWSSSEAVGQYTTCTINAGITLTVPTGTILRCSGSFTNEGTITVSNPYLPSDLGIAGVGGDIFPDLQESSAGGLGWGRRAAGSGAYGSNASLIQGGSAGSTLTARFQYNLLRPGMIGGGAGGGPVGSSGGNGGGNLTVRAGGAIINNGTIRANGTSSVFPGGGGGAGGIVILASKSSVTIGSSGVLQANGGDGGASDTFRANGGGGGGGLIYLLGPVITNSGTSQVDGGSVGSVPGAVSLSPRAGGAAGGSMVGAGGAGGNVTTGGTATGAAAGSAGSSIQLVTDPTALFL